MPSPTIQLSAPSPSLFQFPPSDDPRVLPPREAGSTLIAPPFTIPPSLYEKALDVRVPITIACVYAVTVIAINRWNKSNGNKPWAISKTKPFFWFVIVHNVLLAVYSAWTFYGMLAALQRTVAHWNGPAGLAGTVDSLCKMHGPSGLGNAITYNATLSGWISESPSTVHLSDMGTPDSTDLGRLWNEGLAFYGWFFYLSKFYEVMDTVIILAKGKRSSTLQTYHHAGAMMCMWAGVRFMSPPIWMFVLVNSAIHAMMYTYYTLTALSIRIPQPIKRSLTTMQIMQFLVGAFYAALHSFVSYTIPVQVPISKSAQALSSASSAATAVASASVGSVLKKILLRAAAEEGVAEKVGGANAASHTPSNAYRNSQEPTFRTEYQTIPCVDTSGQTFAIWLNVLYLTPLTFLFVRFFVKSYLRRSSKATGRQRRHSQLEKAGLDALKGIERELNEANGHANGYPKEKANGHAKMNENGNGHARENGKAEMYGNANGHVRENGKTETNGSTEGGKAVLKDPVVKGGDAIMKM